MTKNLAFCFLLLLLSVAQGQDFGKLIFQDDFERSESQEEKDDPQNEWTTSSDKTAMGNKQVDLRDGFLYIYTHEKANHATSVRHAFRFKDGTIGMKVKLDDAGDEIRLNFTDLGEKSVHAGHLFNVTVATEKVILEDLKTGKMNLKIRASRQNKTITKAQSDELAKLQKTFSNKLALGEWHQLHATVKGDEVTCTINGKVIGSFRSPGFGHESKTLIRLLIPHNVSVDEVRIWNND
jgi:uncharacterized protein (DUF952 family)